MLYCRGNGQELLSVLGVTLVCHQNEKYQNCTRPKFLELLITPGPTTMPLILKTRQLLTKALLELGNH